MWWKMMGYKVSAIKIQSINDLKKFDIEGRLIKFLSSENIQVL